MSTIAIVGLLLLFAFVFPDLGRKGGILASQNWTQAGVFLIFLGMGLSLKRTQWIEAFRSRLLIVHLILIQFLVFPLIGWGVLLFFPGIDPRIKFSFFFLCALPTTISTSSVFTQKSGENPALSAIASVSSNLFAVFLTPLWISIYFSNQVIESVPYRQILTPLLLNLILPAILGCLFRPFVGTFFERNSRWISKMNMAIVFLFYMPHFVMFLR